jgi:hypothetical protein
MNYVSCPTSIVDAPVELVWGLLTRPEGWGDFYNMRITSVDPAGTVVVGQTVFAESGPRLLHLKLQFRFTEIDPLHYKLGFDARFPLGITVREDMSCVPVGQDQCRVNYHCGFGFPIGWRGVLMRFVIRSRLDAGPVDSLDRLRRAAEALYACDSQK